MKRLTTFALLGIMALINGEEGQYKDFCRMMQDKGEQPPVFAEYVFNLFDTYFQTFQYIPDHEQRKLTLASYASNTDSLLTGIYIYLNVNRMEMFYVNSCL